jgi:hypothetical protein
MAIARSEDTGAPPDAEELHDLATQAESCVEKLATGLGQAGQDPQLVTNLGQMADILRQIGSGLAKGMKESEPEPAHTIDTAMQETMRERAAARSAAEAPAEPGV